MDLAKVRKAIALNLESVPDVQISPYALSQPTPPGLQIIPPGMEYDKAMRRGVDLWHFVIQGFVALTSDIGSQVLLDSMCQPSGTGSVKAALESDKTLGGLVADLHVTEMTPGRVVIMDGVSPMLLVEWRVEIYAGG